MNTHTADEERGGLIIKQVRDEHKGTYVAVYIDNVKLLCTANTRSFFSAGPPFSEHSYHGAGVAFRLRLLREYGDQN